MQNQFKQLNQLVSISGSFYGPLKKDEYQFTFGGPILNGEINKQDKHFLNIYNGFLVPANGVIKHFTTNSTGIIHDVQFGPTQKDGIKGIIDVYGDKDKPTPIFSLMRISEGRDELIGSVVYYLTDVRNFEDVLDKEKPFYMATPVFEFRPKQKFLNKEENFICSVNQGDIINIRSEHNDKLKPTVENKITFLKEYPKGSVFLHLATLTFLFKEMSFPNILDLDPLDG